MNDQTTESGIDIHSVRMEWRGRRGRHRRPIMRTFAERAWAYRNHGLLVLAAAVAFGLITGAFLAIVQAVN